jgi:hypothetical protein
VPPIDYIDVHYPIAGELRQPAYQSTPPYTSTKLVNTWPRDVFEGRLRGGSRPGLKKAFPGVLPLPVHLLANVRVIEATGITGFEDQFKRDPIADWWQKPTWIPHEPLVDAVGLGYAFAWNTQDITPIAYAAGKILRALSLDTDESYTVQMGVLNNMQGALGDLTDTGLPDGVFRLYLRLVDGNTDVSTAGIAITLNVDKPEDDIHLRVSENGVELARATDLSGFRRQPGNLFTVKATVNSDDTMEVSLNDDILFASVSLSSPQGERIGFRIGGSIGPITSSRPIERRRIDFIKVTYTTADSPFQLDRNIIVAVGGKNASATHSGEVDLRYEDTPGVLVAPTTQGTTAGADDAVNNPVGRHLIGAELLGNLYIVGEDAEEIWQLNPSGTGALYSLTTSPGGSVSGTVPTNCSTIAVWRNRLCVVPRGDPQNCLMCRVGDPYNWVYASLPAGTSAVKLNTTGIDSGKLGEPINALVPHSDDYLILGCLNSLFVQRGDPTAGGKIDRLSSEIGIVSAQAFARGPDGETVWLSHDGLFGLPPGVLAYPQSISRERLPDELRDIDVANFRVLMAYDRRNRGFFIGLTPLISGGGTYYWFDWETRAFQRMNFDSSHEPTALAYRNADLPSDQRLLLGCRDGYIRTLERSAPDDDGVELASEALIGPIALGGGGYFDGMLLEIVGQTGRGSADVICEVKTGRSVEDAFHATPIQAGTLLAGKNRTFRPRIRGNACFIRLTSSGPWSYEMLSMTRQRLGKQRLP